MPVVIDRNFSGVLSHDIADYPEGIVVVIDKAYRWTSADVIRKVKFAAIRHFHKKNLKVGHAGTLDPLATGILLVCIGNACKLAQAFQACDKEYIAGVCFGATTPSYDREKEIDRRFPTDDVNEKAIKAVIPGFIGEQNQVAPLFSAKMVDGVRAYELARKMYGAGMPMDSAAQELLQVNRITIKQMELLSFGKTQKDDDATDCSEGASSRINVAAIPEGLPLTRIRVACSKGTYVRALARDLGEKLSSGAFLESLERTACGEFRVENALNVDSAVSLFSL